MPVPHTPPPDQNRLAAIADRETGDVSPTELRLLTATLNLLAAAEVACGQGVRP